MNDDPKHYQGRSGMSCADFIRDSIGSEGMVNFWRGNALKYIYRAGKKSGSPENFNVDILKAIDCLQRLLGELDSDEKRRSQNASPEGEW